MANEIFNVVLGTAGHIDHGKSALVQALTGIHPDRLKEEQERGITIDLGFAPMQLRNGLRVGIIDVPGHERFIKNMVAGATGIDFVMLVIAADDGVMAQTREHLQIVQLLGVREGLTVITKMDLVETEYLAMQTEEVKAFVSGTLLEGKPIVAVSARTGEGVPQLKALLESALSRHSRRQTDGPFRMPIQRVFAKEGFGTVVTGVPLSGQIATGDTLEILPPGFQGRVKGMHAYNRAIARGEAGHSTAVNLHGPGIDKQKVHRGMTAVTPGIFRPSALVTARFTLLQGTPRPLKHRAAVRFHAGTAEIQGKVLLLEGEQMKPGACGWIQILLDEPAVLAPGDKYILRLQTPMITLGGGSIVDAAPAKRKRRQPAVISELETRLSCLEPALQPAEFLAHLLAASAAPKSLADLCAETGMSPQAVLKIVPQLIERNQAIALKTGTVFIAPAAFQALAGAVVDCIQRYVREHPALGAIELPELRRRLEALIGASRAECFDDLLLALKHKCLVDVQSNSAALPGRERKLEGALAQQAEQVEEAFLNSGLAPPAPAEIEGSLKVQSKTLKEILKYLRDMGKIIEATPEISFHRVHLDRAKSELRALFAQNPNRTTSEIRQCLGMTRKYAVPLVELLDRQKFTVRNGDQRSLMEI